MKEYVVGKPINYVVGKYTVIRDQYGNWSRTVPIEELPHPHSFREYALTPFEQAIAEALLEKNETRTN